MMLKEASNKQDIPNLTERIISLENGLQISYDFYRHSMIDIDKWDIPTKVIYGYKDRLVFINTITNFGFFVELPNLIEGLVHVQTLKGDYFTYVPELLAMIGKSTKKTYRLGDKVKVRCVAASKENSMIDFELVKVDEKDGDKK